MAQPDFKQMTSKQLIDYHLERGSESGALSEYVQRLKTHPDTIWIDPHRSLDELDKMVQLKLDL